MIARLPVVLAAVSALFTVASAQLQILSPGGPNEWWVANNENLLVWNCNESQQQNWTVLVSNPNMPSPLAIIAEQPNFVCSLLVSKDQMGALVPATGYTVLFASIFNSSDVFATSAAFEIKAANSPYPTSTVSPETATFTPSSSGSGSQATSNPSKSNDGASLKVAILPAAFVAVAGIITGIFVL